MGRVDAQRALRTAFDAAVAGGRQVVLVEGIEGMGTTTLVRRFVERLDHEDAAVIFAGCDEAEATLDLGLVDQLLAALGGPLPSGRAPAARPVVDGRPSEPIGGADPAGPSTVMAGAWAADTDPFAAGAGLVLAIGERSDRPLVLVIDDIHWADRPSLLGLSFALRRVPHDRVLVVATVRAPAPADLLASLYSMAETDGAVVRLDGLSLEEARALAGGMGAGALSDRSLARLLEHTDGNVLHLRTMLADPSVLLDPRDVVLPSPVPFEATIASRIALLGAAGRALVEATAVLGTAPPLLDAAVLAGVEASSTTLDQALDEAAAAALLTTRDDADGRRLAFTHPLVRAAAYHGLGVARRSELHSLAAARQHDPRAALRHELSATLGPDASLAARAAAMGAADEADGSWASAASWWLSAARLHSERDAHELDLLRSALCLLVAGDLPAASALVAGTDDFTDRALLRFLKGRTAAHRGDIGTGMAELGLAWQMRDDPSIASAAASHLSAVAFATARPAEAAEWARRAFDLSAPGAGRLDIDPLSRLLLAEGLGGRVEEGLAFASAHPDRIGDDERGHVDGRLGLGALHLLAGRAQVGAEHLAAVAQASRRAGPFHLWCYARAWQAAAATEVGHWDDALRYGMDATAAADTESWSYAVAGWCALAVPLAGRGDLLGAEGAVAQAEDLARRAGESDLLLLILAATRGWLALMTGEPKEAAGLVGEWLDRPAAGLALLSAPAPARTYGLASLRAGDPTGVARASGILAGQPNPAGPAWAALLGLASASAAARSGAALDQESLAGVSRLVEGVTAPFERAHLLLELGSLVRRSGTRRAAVAMLSEARDLFQPMAAKAFLSRIDAEQAMSGLKPRGRSPGPANLTATERIVADMVREGRTNREIATELVLSVKTIEYHLTNVYRKLGVTNRTSLVRALAD